MFDAGVLLAEFVAADLGSWKPWLAAAVGLAAVGLIVLAVGIAYRRRKARERAAAEDLGARYRGDLIREKRQAFRRVGREWTVLLRDPAAGGDPWPGRVVDRSVGGLGLVVSQPAVIGTLLAVRAADASPTVPWTEVEVRSCQQQGGEWRLGCQFLRSPDSNTLMTFG